VSAPRLLLASSSPRRRELLARLGVPFELRAASTDETPRAGETPQALVERLALDKARLAAEAGAVALGADTVVTIDGEILGKPADAEEAGRMLARLSGREHQVWTGVALVGGSDGRAAWELVRSDRSEVAFRALEEGEVASYIASGEPFDKAGGYAIQGGAAGFVAELRGDLTNVVGLPLPLVAAMLEEAGFRPRL
jgi:septum formation protein